MKDLTPHELLHDSYPIAARTISSLAEIVKTNPYLVEQVIELAIVIGINSAHARIEWDKKRDILEKFIPFSSMIQP